MTQKFTLNVNGKTHTVDADPDMPLLYALRDDIGLNNPKFGCGLAQCGACTVHMNGQAIRSCITPMSSVGAAKVVTLAGLGTPEKPHPLQTAYIVEQVPQCGYCINGWIMTAAAFLATKKKLIDAEIKGARRHQVPLRHPCQHPQGGQARRRNDGLRESIMTKMEKPTTLSRRAVLMGAGALVVSIGAPVSLDMLLGIDDAHAQGAKPPLTPDQLSSYIAVNADGTASAFFGKMDMGHGLFVAIGQIVAEELDVPFKAVKVYMGDTATSVNQGGASGSTGIQLGGKQMRMAAAEARRVLLEMASAKLGTPADQLIVVDGAVSAASNRDKKTSYAELIGGKYFNVQLDWNKQMGNALYAPGKAQPKPFKDHKIVGKPIKREDVAPKVFAQEDYCTDIKVPDMVHGRVIPLGRWPQQRTGQDRRKPGHLGDIPGAQVVHQNGFLGVVAPKEWDAILAAEKLKVEWSKVEAPFPNQSALYDHIRKAPVRKQRGRRQDRLQRR